MYSEFPPLPFQPENARNSVTPHGQFKLPKSPWSPSASKQALFSGNKNPVKRKSGTSTSPVNRNTMKKPKTDLSNLLVAPEMESPKKARTPYILFSLACRDKVKNSLNPSCGIADLMNTLETLWKELPESDRQFWINAAADDLNRYNAEKFKYEQYAVDRIAGNTRN